MGTWTLIAVKDGWEYWTDTDGFDHRYSDVFRRKASKYNVTGSDGTPQGVRWECKRSHYERWIAKAELCTDSP